MIRPSRDNVAHLVDGLARPGPESLEPDVERHIGRRFGRLDAYLHGQTEVHLHLGGGRWPCCGKSHYLCATAERAFLDKEDFSPLKKGTGCNLAPVSLHDDEIEGAVLVQVGQLPKRYERIPFGVVLLSTIRLQLL